MLQDVEARRTHRDRLPERRHRALRRASSACRPRSTTTIAALIRGIEDVVKETADGAEQRARAPLREHRAAAMAEHELDALIVSGIGVHAASRAASRTSPGSRSCTATRTSSCRPTAIRSSSSRRRPATSASTARREIEQVFAGRPVRRSPAARAAAGWKRIGVYGLDYIMTVRDYRALEGLDLVHFDVEFDHSRAVKSDAELESVRESRAHQPARLRDLLRALRAAARPRPR